MTFSPISAARGAREQTKYLALSMRRAISPSAEINAESGTTLVFVFLGEFGYELLNWQARIEFFARIYPQVKIVVASRRSCQPLYRSADVFISLESICNYDGMIAETYFARLPGVPANSAADILASRKLRKAIEDGVLKRLDPGGSTYFAFSDVETVVNGLSFGARRFLQGADPCYADIYDHIDTSTSSFVMLRGGQREQLRAQAEGRVLMMRASRSRVVKGLGVVDESQYIRAITKEFPVLLMEFRSSRTEDTTGQFDRVDNVTQVATTSLSDQIDLIQSAAMCLFFTEGDLRSHTYLPPMAGRDVFVVADTDVFRNGAVALWNREIFTFGGQMRPLPTETFGTCRMGIERLLGMIRLELSRDNV